MKRYDQLLQVVRECDYRVVEDPACGCQGAATRCLVARGGAHWDRHEVNPHDCLECTKGGGSHGRAVAEDSEAAEGDDGVADSSDEPPVTDSGNGAAKRGPLVLVNEGPIEREVLRLERELFQLWDEVKRLSEVRFPSIEQQLGSLWYNPVQGCATVSYALTASPGTPQVFGTNITFTATFSGSPTPTGTVQFVQGTTNIGSPVTIAGGVASTSINNLPVGNLTIYANYSGDSFWCADTRNIGYTITSSLVSFCSCPGGGVPSSDITLTDPLYGTFVLHYNSSTHAWNGCKTVSFAGTSSPVCPSGSIAIQHQVACAGFIAINTYYTSNAPCPKPGSVCSGDIVAISTGSFQWNFVTGNCSITKMTGSGTAPIGSNALGYTVGSSTITWTQ